VNCKAKKGINLPIYDTLTWTETNSMSDISETDSTNPSSGQTKKISDTPTHGLNAAPQPTQLDVALSGCGFNKGIHASQSL
jgi:hypothetical protein